MLVEPREQQVPATPPQPALLVTREKSPALGNQVRIRILEEQLPEPETGQRIVGRFGDGLPEPGHGLLTPSEERKAAAELVGGPHRRLFGRGG